MRFIAAIDQSLYGQDYVQGDEVDASSWSSRQIVRLLRRGLIAPGAEGGGGGGDVYTGVWNADTPYAAGQLVNSGTDLWAATKDNTNVLPTATRTYTAVGADNAGANTQAGYDEVYHPLKFNADTLLGAVAIGCLGDPGPTEFWLSKTTGPQGVWEPLPVTAKKTMQPVNTGTLNNTTLWRLTFDDPYQVLAGDQVALVISDPGGTSAIFASQLGFTAGNGPYSGVLVLPSMISAGDLDYYRSHNGSWTYKEAFRRLCVSVIATQDVVWDRIASRV